MNLLKRILLSLLLAALIINVTVVAGVVFYRAGLLSEGIVIIGAVLSIISIGIGTILLNKTDKKDDAAAKAGEVIAAVECRCNIDENGEFACLLVVGEDGIVIDGKEEGLGVIMYGDISEFNDEKSDIYMTADGDNYHIIGDASIKFKAARDSIRKRLK